MPLKREAFERQIAALEAASEQQAAAGHSGEEFGLLFRQHLDTHWAAFVERHGDTDRTFEAWAWAADLVARLVALPKDRPRELAEGSRQEVVAQ